MLQQQLKLHLNSTEDRLHNREEEEDSFLLIYLHGYKRCAHTHTNTRH